MKFILILLLAFSTIKIEANEHENAQQWESICKDFEKDTIFNCCLGNDGYEVAKIIESFSIF